jgi:hypothetical protein
MDIRLNGVGAGIADQDIREHFDMPIVYPTVNSEAKTLEQANLTEPSDYVLKLLQIANCGDYRNSDSAWVGFCEDTT